MDLGGLIETESLWLFNICIEQSPCDFLIPTNPPVHVVKLNCNFSAFVNGF